MTWGRSHMSGGAGEAKVVNVLATGSVDQSIKVCLSLSHVFVFVPGDGMNADDRFGHHSLGLSLYLVVFSCANHSFTQ